MATTGHTPIDEAPQVVAEWLNLLCDDLDWIEHRRAYLLLSETLHAVRDYLTVDEAVDLAAQLPMIIRGLYFTGWNPSGTPVHPRSKEAFLDRVSSAFDKEPLENTEEAVIAVFDLLRRKVSPGEIAHVSQSMRGSLQQLWK